MKELSFMFWFIRHFRVFMPIFVKRVSRLARDKGLIGPNVDQVLQKMMPVLVSLVLVWITAKGMLVGDTTGVTKLKGSPRPPLNAEFLFYLFMTPQNCDALVGDLEERYKLIHKRFGRRRANFWYWTQTVSSLGPIVWAWAKKVVMKPAIAFAGWAVAKGLVGHDSWLAALVELWRRVRS